MCLLRARPLAPTPSTSSFLRSSPLPLRLQSSSKASSSSSSSSSSAAAAPASPLPPLIPPRVIVAPEQRAALRLARRDASAAAAAVAGAKAGTTGAGAAGSVLVGAASSSSQGGGAASAHAKRRLFYGTAGVLTVTFLWGALDETSPPAALWESSGASQVWKDTFSTFIDPNREKLLPDWPMPNVPQDLACPHTLVLDLENTLVNSSWDRKYGWRHAKRPGVDKFLADLSQYYEIVLFSPSIGGVADPVVTSLDKNGCIMHRLYRESTKFVNGVHVKDLSKLNRPLGRIIIIDDDERSAQLQPDNLIRVKPYLDPTDRADDCLSRLTPLLIEIAKEGYADVPALLRQFRGMDADEMAREYRRRLDEIKEQRMAAASRGLGQFVRRAVVPAGQSPPAAAPSSSQQAPLPQQKTITAKELVAGGGATPDEAEPPKTGGFWQSYNDRQKSAAEDQQRKMEKWQEVMAKRAKDKEEQTAQNRG